MQRKKPIVLRSDTLWKHQNDGGTMKEEDKQLLLADLCARLPYGVIVETQLVNAPRAEYPVLKVLQSYMLCDFMQTIDKVIHKPYLRPMSSMTEEEKKEYCNLQDIFLCSSQYPVTNAYELFDWLNKKMFDYRDLIPKGLALKAPKGMYKMEEENV